MQGCFVALLTLRCLMALLRLCAAGPGSYDPKKETHRAPKWRMQGRGNMSTLPPQGTESGTLFPTGQFLNPETVLHQWAGDNAKIGMPSEATKRRLAIKSGLSIPQVTEFFKVRKANSGAPPVASAEGGAPAAEGAPASAEGGGSTAVAVPTTSADGFKENLDGAVDVDWKALSAKMPTGKDAASKAKRKAMWKRADPNGNGYLSLAEVDLMVRDVVGKEMFSAKPAVAAAFHAARQSGGGQQTGRAGDYVEFKEFRKLFVCLRQYYELYAMFNRLDTSDDRRIDSGEFKSGAEMVKGWGVEIKAEELDAEFAAIDADGGGQILFLEFAKWALVKALDLPEDDQAAGEGQEAADHDAVGYVAEHRMATSAQGIVTREPPPRLCYHYEGALIPAQTTARAEPCRSPFSPHSPSRSKASPVFQSKLKKEIMMLGGIPMRTLKVGSKFLPNIPPSKVDPIAGLPYALGQMLLKSSAEDREAEALAKRSIKIEGGWSKRHGNMRGQEIDVRLYGAESLELPKPEAEGDAPKAIEGAPAAAAASSGKGSKKSASVAPA